MIRKPAEGWDDYQGRIKVGACILQRAITQVQPETRFGWLEGESVQDQLKMCELWITWGIYYRIIFDHGFARAFWGYRDSYIIMSESYSLEYREKFQGWKYHLKQLALSEDPLLYMGQFLEKEERHRV